RELNFIPIHKFLPRKEAALLPPLLNPRLPQQVRHRNPAARRAAIVVRAHRRERLQQRPELLRIAGQARRARQRLKVAAGDHEASRCSTPERDPRGTARFISPIAVASEMSPAAAISFALHPACISVQTVSTDSGRSQVASQSNISGSRTSAIPPPPQRQLPRSPGSPGETASPASAAPRAAAAHP